MAELIIIGSFDSHGTDGTEEPRTGTGPSLITIAIIYIGVKISIFRFWIVSEARKILIL